MNELNILCEDLTYFFHWGPEDAFLLAPSEVFKWGKAATRIAKQSNGEVEDDQQRNRQVALAALAEQKRREGRK